MGQIMTSAPRRNRRLTPARMLRHGIREAEHEHGALNDRVGQIVGDRAVTIVPFLELRTERLPPVGIQRV